MIRKLVELGALALLCIGLRTVQAQESSPYPSGSGSVMPINATAPLQAKPLETPTLSKWITGTDPDCCGPIGEGNPLQTELYLRSGLSFPIGSGALVGSIDEGWAIEGGGRALLFNDRGDAAWTLSLGLMNIHNVADNRRPVRLLNVDMTSAAGRATTPSLIASVRSLNRTFVNLGAGREWYLYGSSRGTRDSEGALWRFGIDGGGRYGTAKAEFFEIRHFTDTIAGAYAAIHTDLDIPCGCCTFFAGIRGEADYTWSDILQIQNKSEFAEINLLFSFGVRY